MGIFDRLFNDSDKEITSRDLKVALRGVERERRKKQMEIRKLSNKRTDVLARLKSARRDNNGVSTFSWQPLAGAQCLRTAAHGLCPAGGARRLAAERVRPAAGDPLCAGHPGPWLAR